MEKPTHFMNTQYSCVTKCLQCKNLKTLFTLLFHFAFFTRMTTCFFFLLLLLFLNAVEIIERDYFTTKRIFIKLNYHLFWLLYAEQVLNSVLDIFCFFSFFLLLLFVLVHFFMHLQSIQCLPTHHFLFFSFLLSFSCLICCVSKAQRKKERGEISTVHQMARSLI